jgi:hypothetical protein
MNEIRLLPVKLITVPRGGKDRGAQPLGLLDGAIETEALTPIAVRPDPAREGQYLIISGEDRYHFAAKVLRQEAVKCRVFKDMDEDEAQLAALSETVRPKTIGNAERLELVGKWYKLYSKKYPELIGKRASGNSRWKNRGPKAHEAKPAADTDPKPKPVRAPESKSRGGGEGTQTLLERLSTVTGMSKRAIARDLRIVRGFTEAQFQVLGRVDCAQKDMLRILELTKCDTGKRQRLVSLVAKGMSVKEAIGMVSVPVRNRMAADSESAAETPTGDQWFDKECGRFGESLGNADQYKSDAILYREILDGRTEFRKQIEEIIEEHKKERKNRRSGWLYLSLKFLIRLSHPKDWLRCPHCAGKGLTASDGAKCNACMGSCYQLRPMKDLQGAEA